MQKEPPQTRERRMRMVRVAYDLSMTITNVFTAHPATVGETWAVHARFALSISGQLARAALAAAVHAVVPSLFETTASRTIDSLHALVHGPRSEGSAMIESVETFEA